MKKMSKMLALTLAGTMTLATVLTGCGSSSGSSAEGDEADSFTWLINSDVPAGFYDSWDDNPTLNYYLDMEWDADGDGEGKKIDLELTAPVAGAEKDNVNTLIATGEYMDIMSMSYVSTPISELYEDGMVLDLTDYVDQYMPNYKAWLEAHPEQAAQMVNYVDGEPRYLQLYAVQDVQSPNFGGWLYRRDWIVKYGTNPETGEAFTGGYTEDGGWEDDVVFPSGNTDPIYISDWEWMFEIFEKAFDDLGIDDGYCTQISYAGYIQLGDFVTGFGSINPNWYIDPDSGEVTFGGTSEGFRAYLECMNTWYEKGWVDQSFEERSSDLFFHIDNESVFSGKVGAYYSGNGQFGSGLATEDSDEPGLEGICIFGAPQPINDLYGDASVQNKIPVSYYTKSLVGESIVITDKAAEKDLPTLLTAIDYLYSYEGGLLSEWGFSDEQQSEVNSEYYIEQGLPNGSYTMVERDGEMVPQIENTVLDVENLKLTLHLPLGVGQAIADCDYGYTNIRQHSYDMWTLYEDTATIPAALTSQLSSDQASENSLISTNINTYMSQAAGDFITGRKDISSDSDWQAYVDEINTYDPDQYAENINSLLN